MILELLDARIAHINETIKQTSSQVQFFTQNLQSTTQQLQALHGHLNECMHWKQTLAATQQSLSPTDSESSKGCDDGQTNSEEQEQAA